MSYYTDLGFAPGVDPYGPVNSKFGTYTPFKPTGIGDWKTAFDKGTTDSFMKQYDQQYNQWANTPQQGFTPDSWKQLMQSLLPQPGSTIQPSTPAGPGTVAPGQGGSLANDTINYQAPPGTVGYQPPPGTTRTPQFTQNQGTSPFQNTQYNPLTPYNFTSIGGQGSMNQNPYLNNAPSGGTMMNQSQGFYKSLPNYGFYQ